MTASNFPACLAIILQSEGGFVDDSEDPGGATNHGVTLATWSGWVGRTATIAEIEALTVADVTPLYRQEFWAPARCDALPTGVDLMVFDCAVNSGVGRAIRTLQTAAGDVPDGIYGHETEASVRAAEPAALINAFAAARLVFYRALPTFSRFGRGWVDRVDRTQQAALAMIAPAANAGAG